MATTETVLCPGCGNVAIYQGTQDGLKIYRCIGPDQHLVRQKGEDEPRCTALLTKPTSTS